MSIQQLRAQIAALQDATMDENRNFRSAYDEGKFDALTAVDALLDSMQEEPVSEDLNTAAKSYSNNLDNICGSIGKQTRNAFKAGAKWQREKDESITKDLGDYINELSKQFPEVSFAKLSRIAVRVAKWQKSNLWKPADGDDLPEIDREVIALLDNGKVVFAHRPNPEGWDAKSIITEKVERYIPETYGKGGWNIPDVKWWLDCSMPNMED